MSYTSITQSVRDPALNDRILAAIAKQTWGNPTVGASSAGLLVQKSGPGIIFGELVWPCCVDFEAAYEYAVGAGNPAPGLDPGVIPDANILSAVAAHWPATP